MPYARIAAMLVREHHARTVTVHERKLIKRLLRELCRHTPWRRFYVSQAAQAKGGELALGDLSYYHWDHQPRRMKDPVRETFAWEHVWTVAELRAALLRIEEPTEANARQVLNRACGAWILGIENQKLNDAGYKSVRPRPFAAYRGVGIELVRATRIPTTLWIDPAKR